MEKTRKTNRFQSFLAFALAFIMMLSLMPMQALAADALTGDGTKANPYLIATAEDFQLVRKDLKAKDYKGQYLKITQDITMPAGWVPMGTNGEKFFAGNLEGDGHTLTFPAGSKPLFQTVHGMKLSNLNIVAPFMDGYAVVNQHKQVGGGLTAEFKNVNIKSGSRIKLGGYIGGYASGSDVVNFYNCTVEKNVKIGVNADGSSSNQDYVGSFSGRTNGTLKNCVSYADVYGKSRVGGIMGGMGQSMGKCHLEDCQFYGNVTASGTMVGGILGAGYSDTKFGVAPNAPCATMIGCKATGNIVGKDMVGGIFGSERTLQCWDNGIGQIKNNTFEGHVQGTGKAVGGIVGFMQGLDKYNKISGNVYEDDCGAKAGAGTIKYIDTSCATHETASGSVYFDTSKAIPTIPAEDIGKGWGKGTIRKDHNRTDDPLGADAAALWAAKPAPKMSALAASGTYKNEYIEGEELDLTGIVLTVTWTDGTTTNLALADVTVTGFDAAKLGEQTLTDSNDTVSCEITVTVKELPLPEELPFKDVAKDRWYFQFVARAYQKGIMSGISETEFEPLRSLTRAEFARILYNVAGRPEVKAENPFSDVKAGSWYYDAVIWAAEEGFVAGYGDGKFAPGKQVTRQEMISMLWRYAGKPKAEGNLSAFTDLDEMAKYAEPAMAWAVAAGIVSGNGNGKLNPAGNALRAEVARIMVSYTKLG